MSDITPIEAASLLKKSGLIVTVEEAEKILTFLRMLASIIIENYLKGNSDNIGSEQITNCEGVSKVI
jgi:hypothetical protein